MSKLRIQSRRIEPWRVCFVLAALAIIVGGPQHPGGTMAQMLANPAWVPSHTLLLAGFVALLVGLVAYGRAVAVPASARHWYRLALVGAALQAIEMAFHTAAVVDHHNLMAGRPTPVLTIHLALSVVCYPAFGLTLAAFIVATARQRLLASPWIAWLGVIGALAHGAAAPLVVTFHLGWARALFPMVLLFALWLLLAAAWPLRREVLGAAKAAAPASA